MRIGYFGGSFDPPHRGHLKVARAAATAFGLEPVLFVPTGRQPLKPAGPMASFADRLQMVRLLCEDDEDFIASDLETPLPGEAPSFTVDTLRRLKSTLAPADSIFVLLGADAFQDLPRWREPEHVLALGELIVLSRPGAPLHELSLPLTAAQLLRVHLLPALDDRNASTLVREELLQGANDDVLLASLPAAVLRYIRERGLYAR